LFWRGFVQHCVVFLSCKEHGLGALSFFFCVLQISALPDGPMKIAIDNVCYGRVEREKSVKGKAISKHWVSDEERRQGLPKRIYKSNLEVFFYDFYTCNFMTTI
jgi:hypothetical protein